MRSTVVKVGLVGGMSWYATSYYYQLIQQHFDCKILSQKKILRFPQLLISSLPVYFAPDLKDNELETVIVDEALNLEKIGAEAIAITCNTVHCFFDKIQSQIGVPIIHIVNPMYNMVQEQSSQRIAVIATHTSIKRRVHESYLRGCGSNIDVIYPSDTQIDMIDKIILDYSGGVRRESFKLQLQEVCLDLLSKDVEFVWLGCTELGLILGDLDFSSKIYDSAIMHSRMIIDFINKSA